MKALRRMYLRWCLDTAEDELREMQTQPWASGIALVRRMRHIASLRGRIQRAT
jgi:hypothetical protein